MGSYAEAGGDVGDGTIVHVAFEEDLPVVLGEVGQGGAEHGDVGVAFGVQLGACYWGSEAVEGVVFYGAGASGFAGHGDGFVDRGASPVGGGVVDGAAGGDDADHFFEGAAGGFLGVDAGYACGDRPHHVGTMHDPVVDTAGHQWWSRRPASSGLHAVALFLLNNCRDPQPGGDSTVRAKGMKAAIRNPLAKLCPEWPQNAAFCAEPTRSSIRKDWRAAPASVG